MIGYAGPPSGKATEASSKDIVTDRCSKGLQGMAPADAAREFKQIDEA